MKTKDLDAAGYVRNAKSTCKRDLRDEINSRDTGAYQGMHSGLVGASVLYQQATVRFPLVPQMMSSSEISTVNGCISDDCTGCLIC